MSQNPSEENMTENENLDNLFIKFSQETDHHEKSKLLCSLIHAYIQYFENDLDTNVKSDEFLQLLSQIPLLCEKFLQNSESSSNDETINKKKNLESASLCFHAILQCLENFYMTNQCIIIIKIALKILSQGYTHCKESETIYGDLLEQFADQLGAFFKIIEKLQTAILQHLDKLDMVKYAEDDIQINSIIVEMGNLCVIVFTLDADVAFEMWTTYLRIITHHKSLKYVSNINDISTYLASKNVDLMWEIKESLLKNSELDGELAAKFFFYLDALSNLMNLVQDCFIENELSFLTPLFECLILCYSLFITEKTSLDIIKSSLKKNIFGIMSHVCTNKEFLTCLSFLPHDAEFHSSTILLKLCSLQYTKSISLEQKENFLKSIFSDLLLNNDHCNMKLLNISVPRCSITKTKSDELVSLYQVAYEIIAESLKLMPDSAIEKMECTILNYLVTSSDTIYLLISDIWIYRLRCSTIEFLKERCYAVLQNLHKENVNNHKIENLIKRMLRFLPTSDKDSLLETFNSIKFIQESQNIHHRYGIPDYTSTENEIKLNSEVQIKIMICELNENSSDDATNLIKKACTCLELCTLFVTAARCSEILQFLELASELFRTDIYEVQIATLSFLKSLSRKTMIEHTQEFGKIVTILSQLFSETMHSKNYIVKFEARNIFSHFAKSTPHLKIVQETVKRDPTLKLILKSHMNMVPVTNFLTAKEKADYLLKQSFIQKNIQFPPKGLESLQQLFSRTN